MYYKSIYSREELFVLGWYGVTEGCVDASQLHGPWFDLGL